jgi:hypothetical protein
MAEMFDPAALILPESFRDRERRYSNWMPYPK